MYNKQVKEEGPCGMDLSLGLDDIRLKEKPLTQLNLENKEGNSPQDVFVHLQCGLVCH